MGAGRQTDRRHRGWNALLPTHSGNITTLIGEQVYKLKFGNVDVVGKYVPEDREVSIILALDNVFQAVN
ncbi:hypothetical protein ASG81_09115 [Paenibacillus sp. Soil522]|nr:hypothetical protein ASG81_09115 [Paenibacillus sp. Soil522]